MEFSSTLNNVYLCEDSNKSKLFLHSDNFLNIIHFVEYHNEICTRRIEFKKRVNDDSKYLYFSIFITNDTVFSGDIKISSNFITGSFSLEKLKQKTHIVESFNINVTPNTYTLAHILTSNKSLNLIDNKHVTLTLTNIDNFFQYILSQINNYYLHQFVKPYSPNINFTSIFEFEKEILLDLKNLNNPDITSFIQNYENHNSLKRAKNIA